MSRYVGAIIIDARNLIRNPGNWCKASFAQDEYGDDVSYSDPEAAKFCAMGSLAKVLGPEGEEEHYAIAKFMRGIIGKPVVCVNDYGSHAEVMKAFEKCIEASGDKTIASLMGSTS